MEGPVLLEAPAKVNLGLRIVGRRDDGYHLLESLFVPLDWTDVVRVQALPADAPEVAFRCAGGDGQVPADGSNLAARAARAFLDAAGLRARVVIELEKRTAVAAGLGGGSSDAAAVLLGLCRTWPEAVAPADLASVALGLGADVPFFLDPRPTWVRGIGEQLEPASDVPSFALLLANPGTPLATAEVYRAYDALGRPTSPLREGPPPELRGPATPALEDLLHNDLEEAAVRLCPAIGRLRRRLRELGALAVGMSGSGATVFGVFPDRATAEAAADRAGGQEPAWWRVAATAESR